MDSIQIEAIGFLAAIFTTSAFVPQVYKIWRFRNSDGVSLTMYLVMLSGVLLWVLYGWFIKSISIVVANSLAAILQAIIIFFKLKVR
tara:strand:+ start:1227 stop:1487 length:261 start_codon:yes stop_codon:yes gene_type:complete